MKLNKERVLDFMKTLNECAPSNSGITTDQLASKLQMQRTNLSAILNDLASDGKVEKLKGRPVYFRLLAYKQEDFQQLVGYNGSLKNSIMAAQAAMLYPRNNLHVLLLGENGSGKSTFVKSMYSYTLKNGSFATCSKFAKINCKHYLDGEEELENILTQISKDEYSINGLNGGMIFIDHIEKLKSNQKRILIKMLEDGENINNDQKVILICGYDSSNEEEKNLYLQKFPLTIFIPSFEQRPLQERYELVERFFQEEIEVLNKKIVVDASLMKCLLLYDCDNSIKILKTDIKSGITKAYGRCITSDSIVMTFSDLNPKVRSGYLFYKKNKYIVDKLIKANCRYCMDHHHKGFFTEEFSSNVNDENLDDGKFEVQDVDFDMKIDDQIKLHMLEEKIDSYVANVDEKVDITQISKVCDKSVINEVSDFLMEIKQKVGKIFPTTIVYSLCLHMNSLLDGKEKQNKFSMQQLMEVMSQHKQEYQWSLDFCAKFEKNHKLKLPIDEAVFVTLFLVNQDSNNCESDQVAVLIAMHGNGAANSIVNTVKTLIGTNNIYGFDLDLNEEIADIYEKLKRKIVEINKNRGVLMIYDMGSFKSMSQMIELETSIPIRLIQMPLTLVAIDGSRKAEFGKNLDEIYQSLISSTESYSKDEALIYSKVKSEKVIITLCMSGEGGAKRVKEYLENDCEIRDIQIIPLAISLRNELLKRIADISSKQQIVCIIGSYNPQLYGIRFVDYEQLFACDVIDVKGLLLNEKQPISKVDIDQIFDYLKSQLKGLDTNKLKDPLIECISKLSKLFDLNKSVSIGLIMHIGSMIDNLVKMNDMPVYSNSKEILNNYSLEAKKIKSSLARLEETFDVDVGNDEIAGIISIIKKL